MTGAGIRPSAALVLASALVLLSPSAIAGVANVASGEADNLPAVWGGIAAIVGPIILALLKIVPLIINLVTKATELLVRIEKKLDEDAKRNADLFSKLLLEAADRVHDAQPDKKP